MTKLTFIFLSLFISLSAFAQFGYKYELKSIEGIEIKYKIVHEKFFDKDSPVQLRLKLKNTNEHDVNVNFEIEYQFDLTKKYKSGNIEIEIPAKAARTGKWHGLVFEIKSNNKEIFDNENAEWEFVIFEVKKMREN